MKKKEKKTWTPKVAPRPSGVLLVMSGGPNFLGSFFFDLFEGISGLRSGCHRICSRSSRQTSRSPASPSCSHVSVFLFRPIFLPTRRPVYPRRLLECASTLRDGLGLPSCSGLSFSSTNTYFLPQKKVLFLLKNSIFAFGHIPISQLSTNIWQHFLISSPFKWSLPLLPTSCSKTSPSFIDSSSEPEYPSHHFCVPSFDLLQSHSTPRPTFAPKAEKKHW